MKAFRFRLDQVLRWRSVQFSLAQAELGRAVERLAGLQRAEKQLLDQIAETALARAAGMTGTELLLLENWRKKTQRDIAQLKLQQAEAEAAVVDRRSKLTDANRRLRLLERLREQRHEEWQAEFNLELESFAAEAYLAGQRRMELRARSSGG